MEGAGEASLTGVEEVRRESRWGKRRLGGGDTRQGLGQ